MGQTQEFIEGRSDSDGQVNKVARERFFTVKAGSQLVRRVLGPQRAETATVVGQTTADSEIEQMDRQGEQRYAA